MNFRVISRFGGESMLLTVLAIFVLRNVLLSLRHERVAEGLHAISFFCFIGLDRGHVAFPRARCDLCRSQLQSHNDSRSLEVDLDGSRTFSFITNFTVFANIQ